MLWRLQVQPHILGAWIFRTDGELFAQYLRADVASGTAESRAEDGASFEGGHLVVWRRIDFGKDTLGSFQIHSDLEAIDARRRNYLIILAAVIVGVSAVALLFSAWLQGLISKPILELVDVVNTVSAKKDYSTRVKKKSEDELGRLRARDSPASSKSPTSSWNAATFASIVHRKKRSPLLSASDRASTISLLDVGR